MNKNVFVAMPFTSTPSRDKKALDNFYEFTLNQTLSNLVIETTRFTVTRSDHEFNINESMISSIAECDIFIADLSGVNGNPNVMYELGVRLAISDSPTILIRENHIDNRALFDIAHLHTFTYDSTDTSLLTRYLVAKITAYEKEAELYKSPVLDALSAGAPYFYRASMTVARRKIDLLYNALYQNFTMVVEKTLNSIVLKHPEQKEKLVEDVFTGKGLYHRAKNFVDAIEDKPAMYLYEGSLIRNLALRNSILENYILEYYLHKLLPDSIESKVNACLVEFHQTFHTSGSFDDFDSYMAIHHFTRKTFLVLLIVSHVGVYLSLDSKEYREKQLEKIDICCNQYLEYLDGIDSFLKGFLNEKPSDDLYEEI